MDKPILKQAYDDGFKHGLADGKEWGRQLAQVCYDDGFHDGSAMLDSRPFVLSVIVFMAGLITGAAIATALGVL